MHRYEAAVASGKLTPDAAQRHAAESMQQLADKLIADTTPRRWFGLAKAPVAPAGGLYIWGDVGRGKSMLMDLFVETIQQQKKTRRVHFHAFMQDIHKRIFAYRQLHQGDVIEQVIDELADELQILCLDELQVTDVADAMILSRLFSGVMDAGVTVLFTSNRPPQELYQGGLQREQFLKFIDLIEARMTMVEINGPQDYRLAQMKALSTPYLYPCDTVADDFLLQSWASLTGGAPSEPLRLEVDGRILRVDKQAGGIVWFTFAELCERPLGAHDYLMIAKLFHTVLLQGIPRLGKEQRNEAKRFVTLIDTLYDQRVKFIATADTAPEDIYAVGDGTFEFHRTVSRLHEMQSEEYLKLPHLA